MSRRLVPVILVVAVVIALGVWRWRAVSERSQTAIRGSGIIEVTQVDVAFEVPGRMVERYADEGAMLDKGEPVARLDDREYRLQVERATAAKAAAEAHYRMLMKGPRAQEVDQALAALESAESDFRLQQREQKRIADLFKDGVVSQGELDRANTALAGAQAARDRAQSQLDMLREGFRTEEIEQARALTHQADKQLELAQLNLDRCQLFAPAAGRVLSKSREPGEMVQPGTTIVTIGDLSHPWVNVYVGERDLGKIWLGMKAYVSVDSFRLRPRRVHAEEHPDPGRARQAGLSRQGRGRDA